MGVERKKMLDQKSDATIDGKLNSMPLNMSIKQQEEEDEARQEEQ